MKRLAYIHTLSFLQMPDFLSVISEEMLFLTQLLDLTRIDTAPPLILLNAKTLHLCFCMSLIFVKAF